MTAQKCGEFIAILRKEKELTQKQLAEILNVSDKAVSRWETGKGYPDVSSLVSLSEYFNVTINEILAGECVSPENLPNLADKNIINIIEKNEKHKRIGLIQTILISIFFVAVMVPPFVAVVCEIVKLKPVISDESFQGFVILSLVSLCLIICGISIRVGNIKLIHSYHYTRVTDRAGYCKAMSVPMIVLGILLIISGGIMLLASVHYIAEIISTVITVGSAVVCILWIFKVQFKYNGGIF